MLGPFAYQVIFGGSLGTTSRLWVRIGVGARCGAKRVNARLDRIRCPRSRSADIASRCGGAPGPGIGRAWRGAPSESRLGHSTRAGPAPRVSCSAPGGLFPALVQFQRGAVGAEPSPGRRSAPGPPLENRLELHGDEFWPRPRGSGTIAWETVAPAAAASQFRAARFKMPCGSTWLRSARSRA